MRQRNLVGRMYMLQVIENIVLQETVTDLSKQSGTVGKIDGFREELSKGSSFFAAKESCRPDVHVTGNRKHSFAGNGYRFLKIG